MKDASLHKKFIFNSHIDDEWLYSLYDYDYPYVAEVFHSSLNTLKDELPLLVNAFEAFDLTGLRKTIHKIKPIFGYTGLLKHQEALDRFEHACGNASGTSNLTMQFIEISEQIQDGKSIIQEEYNRLTAFIS